MGCLSIEQNWVLEQPKPINFCYTMKNFILTTATIFILAFVSCKQTNNEPQTESPKKPDEFREWMQAEADSHNAKIIVPKDLPALISEVVKQLKLQGTQTSGILSEGNLPYRSYSCIKSEASIYEIRGDVTLVNDEKKIWSIQLRGTYDNYDTDLSVFDFHGDGFERDHTYGDVFYSKNFRGEQLIKDHGSKEFFNLPLQYKKEADSLYYQKLRQSYFLMTLMY